jgi:hypothetical protein
MLILRNLSSGRPSPSSERRKMVEAGEELSVPLSRLLCFR